MKGGNKSIWLIWLFAHAIPKLSGLIGSADEERKRQIG